MDSNNKTLGLDMKKSSVVTLVLLGTIVMSCEKERVNYQYKTKQECAKDWGETECRTDYTRSSSGVYPYFFANQLSSSRPIHGGFVSSTAKAVPSTSSSVSRGGFGSTGRSSSFSSSGS